MRLIDADKLKDAECAECQFAYKDVETCRELGCGIMERIDEQPTVGPVKHGHWVKYADGTNWNCYSCSVCRNHIKVPYGCKMPNYCDDCGSKMDEILESVLLSAT